MEIIRLAEVIQQLPDLSRVEVVRQLIAIDPAIRVLMLSASADQQDVLDALKAGQSGRLHTRFIAYRRKLLCFCPDPAQWVTANCCHFLILVHYVKAVDLNI